MRPTLTCHASRSILRSLESRLLVNWQGLLCEEPPMPSVDLPTDAFRREWLVYNILRKREVERPVTSEAAIAAFDATEDRCATIERTQSITSNLDWLAKWTLLGARSIAHEVLGSVPHDWLSECVFTGGASTSRKRDVSHPALKWWASPPLDVTPLALKHLMRFKERYAVIDTAWDHPGILSMTSCEHEPRIFYNMVPGSRFSLVEKNYKTKRVILIEPDGNMLLQKGVGNIIRDRLKRVNIDLDDQTRNQRLAYSGSISGTLGTVDLSAASDSVTLSLLRLILPEDWYELIYELRSPCYNRDGVWRTMRKVSSMGNGFTFELESLVFYCLTKAVVDLLRPKDRRIGIYGDDIIVASSVCGALESVMSRCGFSFNTEKSFWRGPFRESCGKHYHNGADVTPVYIKSDLDCMSQRYRLYNQLREWAGGEFFDPRYTRMLDHVLAFIPKKERHQVPSCYGSTSGLHFNVDGITPIVHKVGRRGILTAHFSVLAPSRTDLTDRLDSEACWLYRHCERWDPSDPLGRKDYAPLEFILEGELERRRVSVPVSCLNPAKP